MLQKSREATETEKKQMDNEQKDANFQMTSLEQSIMTLHTKTKQLRDNIMNHISQQKTIEKSSANLINQTKTKYQAISDKEVEQEEFANEISRVKIDVLNAKQQNEILSNKLKQLQDEQQKKDREVTKFEQRIKETLNDIQSKQYDVDRLNKQLGQLKKNGQDENTTPLENVVNNLKKQNIEKQDEIDQVQKDWISNQTALVEKQHKYTDIQEKKDEPVVVLTRV